MSKAYLPSPATRTRVRRPGRSRRSPVQDRSRQKVAWILEGATRVFERDGLRGTTNDIAKEAGVSVGTLYEYFPDKFALLEALANQHLDRATEMANSLLSRWNQNPPRTTGAIVSDVVGLILRANDDHPACHRLLSSLSSSFPEVTQRARSLQDSVVRHLATHLKRLQPSLDSPDQRAAMLVTVLASTVHSTIPPVELRCGPSPRLSTHLEALASAYLAAPLGSPTPKPRTPLASDR
ncbi:MAG: TetR/AcrR family transcriptional regulator [Myxococcales bacterium]|nr:TetR/AcrR family transcriptional regulator [Myxococcales bacterium]